MNDEANSGRPKPYFMTEVLPRESMPPLFLDMPCPTRWDVSLRVVTVDSKQIVYWKWLPRQDDESHKRAEG